MTPDQLIALAERLRDHASDYITHPDDACKHSDLLAASEYLRQCAQAEPIAYRVEIRWRNRALDQSWRKYAGTAYRDRAISLRDSTNSMEIESRIVPLYAGKPEGE